MPAFRPAGRSGHASTTAASVKGMDNQMIESKTLEITLEQAPKLIQSVDTGHVVGLRDRAILATLA